MSKFRPSLISSAVSIMLASVSASAATNNNVTSIQISNSSSYAPALASFDAKKQQDMAAKQTMSGMKSHYDKTLGKASFLWANRSVAKPNLSNVAKEQQAQFSAGHYVSALTGMSSDKNSFEQAVMSNLHDIKKGALVAKYKQEINGVEVFNREYNVVMDRELNLVASSGYFSKSKANKRDLSLFAKTGSEEQAIMRAFQDMDKSLKVSLSNEHSGGKYKVFNAESLNHDKAIIGTPRAKQVLFDSNDGLRQAYYVEVSMGHANSVDSQSFSYVIDASNNKVLFKNNLSSNHNEFTYRVYANADGYPMEGPHGDVLPKLDDGPDTTVILDAPLVTLAFYSDISTQDPWLSEDATITSGNNVFAYADVLSPEGFSNGDINAELTSPNTFDYVLRTDETANSLNNRKAAVVNMFYMNNFLHDFFYDYGFDEASGNAQLSNYDRGGVEGDPLLAEAQDNSGFNNANIGVPADGASPRMQMFLFDSKDIPAEFSATVTSDDTVGPLQFIQLAGYGPQQYEVSGEVAKFINDTSDGCVAATNGADLTGKIVLINRTLVCDFPTMTLNAQNEGAIGVIIANMQGVDGSDDAPTPLQFGDSQAVTIPSIGISFNEGEQLDNILSSITNNTLEMTMSNTRHLKDSSFDNSVIAHEWGHYISGRLIGNANGLSNVQGGSMGEGWADFHSLMFTVLGSDIAIPGNDEFSVAYADTTFVGDFYTGFRRAPYSTNMDVNPLTFKHIETGATPPGLRATDGGLHDAGEVWATVLWEVYVALINEHGFETAQDRMSRYLIEGYKMTPISPTFTEARDAILAAVVTNDASDFDLALAAFAKRGFGLGAISPERDSTDRSGVVESFATELATFSGDNVTLDTSFNSPTLGFCSNDGILDRGETGTVNVSVTNRGNSALSGVTAQVEVTSGHDVTLENGGLITFADLVPFVETTMPLNLSLNEAGTGDTLELKVTFSDVIQDDKIIQVPALELSATVNVDFQKLEIDNNQAVDNMESIATFSNFAENVILGGSRAIGTQSLDSSGNVGVLASLNPSVELGSQIMYLNNNDFSSDVAVETEAVEVGFGSDFVISFWHFYGLEEGYDGGVVEMSLNGGNWVDVTAQGGQFAVGYDGPLQGNLLGRDTFTGRNGDLSTTAGNVESISFGSSLNGQTVRFRFRVSTDGDANDLGWSIDNVKFTNIVSPIFSEVVAGDTFACDNVAPFVSVDGDTRVTESATGTLTAAATDRNGDILSYSWTQTSGPAATLTGADTATLSFTPPSISADSELEFVVMVSDGLETVTATTIAVVANETPPPAPSRRVGGGSMGWVSLLLVPLMFIRKRKHNATIQCN